MRNQLHDSSPRGELLESPPHVADRASCEKTVTLAIQGSKSPTLVLTRGTVRIGEKLATFGLISL